jgi:hypothetical protein
MDGYLYEVRVTFGVFEVFSSSEVEVVVGQHAQYFELVVGCCCVGCCVEG